MYKSYMSLLEVHLAMQLMHPNQCHVLIIMEVYHRMCHIVISSRSSATTSTTDIALLQISCQLLHHLLQFIYFIIKMMV